MPTLKVMESLPGEIRKRTPEEWVSTLSLLPTPLRGAIAKMVWWDLFSIGLAANRITHFDPWLRFDKRELQIPDNELLQGLIQVGYAQSAKPRLKYKEIPADTAQANGALVIAGEEQ